MTVSYGGFSCNGRILPSVSQILASDDKYLIRKKANGVRRARTPEHIQRSNDGRKRGISIHNSVNQYLTTGDADISAEYLPYWDGIYSQLKHLDIVPFFAERPLMEEHSFMTNGEQSCVWSDRYKFSGIPDLIGSIGGVNCACEFKTSSHLFNKNYDRKKFHEYHEWHSYSQAGAQVAAYGLAFEELTDIKIEAGLIIVATPKQSQMFVLDSDEFRSRQKKFKTLANKYNK